MGELGQKLVKDLKSHVDEQIGGLKSHVDKQIGGLEASLEEQVGGLRSDFGEQIGGLRHDFGEQVGGLRHDFEKAHMVEVQKIARSLTVGLAQRLNRDETHPQFQKRGHGLLFSSEGRFHIATCAHVAAEFMHSWTLEPQNDDPCAREIKLTYKMDEGQDDKEILCFLIGKGDMFIPKAYLKDNIDFAILTVQLAVRCYGVGHSLEWERPANINGMDAVGHSNAVMKGRAKALGLSARSGINDTAVPGTSGTTMLGNNGHIIGLVKGVASGNLPSPPPNGMYTMFHADQPYDAETFNNTCDLFRVKDGKVFELQDYVLWQRRMKLSLSWWRQLVWFIRYVVRGKAYYYLPSRAQNSVEDLVLHNESGGFDVSSLVCMEGKSFNPPDPDNEVEPRD